MTKRDARYMKNDRLCDARYMFSSGNRDARYMWISRVIHRRFAGMLAATTSVRKLRCGALHRLLAKPEDVSRLKDCRQHQELA